jgi:hypothetical protein
MEPWSNAAIVEHGVCGAILLHDPSLRWQALKFHGFEHDNCQYEYHNSEYYPQTCLWSQASSTYWDQLIRFNLKTETTQSPKRFIVNKREDGG